MELVLKRYFWTVPLIVIGVCAVLLARATNHVIEAKYLLGPAKAKHATPVRPIAAMPKPDDKAPSKDAELVSTRNIFCSTCEPPKPAQPADVAAAPPSDPNNPPATSLPLMLMATSVASEERWSTATIANTSEGKQGMYIFGEVIPGGGPIVRIGSQHVDFRNNGAGRIERILLDGATPPPVVAAAPSTAGVKTEPATPDGEFAAAVDKGVKKIDDTHYEIDRGLVDRALGDPTVVARAARIVASIKDGKPNGFKLYAIRPNSVFAKLGLQNGDTLHAVNGFEMTSPDKALEVYTKVKSASNLSINITRRGKPQQMEYTIK